LAGDNNDYERSHERTYEVSFTNLTPGQHITLLMIASHRAGMTFLDSSSEELASLAEAGNGRPMADKSLEMSVVTSAVVGETGNPIGGCSTV